MPKFYNLYLSNPLVADGSNAPLNNPIPLVLEADLEKPLLTKPSDWDVSVVRFVIPAYSLPLFTFKAGAYWIELIYGSQQIQRTVLWDPNVNGSQHFRIYDIQLFLVLVNQTITTAFNAFNPPAASKYKPYFTYNEQTQLFGYVCHQTSPIQLRISASLYVFFQGLPILYFPPTASPNAKYFPYQLSVYDLHNNTIVESGESYYVMTQQGNSFANYSEVDGFYLTSNLPIAHEFSNSGSNIVGNNSGMIGLPIISDYSPSEFNVFDYHNRLVYNAVTPYRQVPLTNDHPFYNIKIYVYYSTVDGELVPMLLGSGQSANIKLMFTEKIKNRYG